VTKCKRGICLGVCSRPPESAEDPRGKDHIEGPASGPPKIPDITGIQWGISLGNQPKYRTSQEQPGKIYKNIEKWWNIDILEIWETPSLAKKKMEESAGSGIKS
jgi:hypothetical protein